MLAPILRRALLQSPSQSFVLPPTFLLPCRAQLSTVANTTSPNPPPSAFRPENPSSTAPSAATTTPSPPSLSSNTAQPPQSGLHPSSEPQPSTPVPPPNLLIALASQRPHYIIAHLHAHPYMLTAGDKLRLPFRLSNAPVGTVLRFNRASMIGSRDYTWRGTPWVDERFFVCRMRVVAIEGEPMRVELKTKRRQRRVKTVRSKMRFTVLRCVELSVLGDGMEEEGDGKGERDSDRASSPRDGMEEEGDGKGEGDSERASSLRDGMEEEGDGMGERDSERASSPRDGMEEEGDGKGEGDSERASSPRDGMEEEGDGKGEVDSERASSPRDGMEEEGDGKGERDSERGS